MRATRNPRLGSAVFDTANAVFMVLFAIIVLYPFWETVVMSLMPASEARALGPKLWTSSPRLESYRIALSSRLVYFGYRNTIFRTVVGTIAGVFLTFCTAYPLAKRNLPARTLLTVFYLIPMFFSGGLIPTYLLMRSLGLIDNVLVYIFPVLLSTYNILIMRNFIMTVPESLEESALMDGATFLQVMVRIIMPVSVPVMATIALWVAVMHWNAWFDSMIYIRDESKLVLQQVLRRVIIDSDSTSMDSMMGESDSVTGAEMVIPETVRAATIMITIGPIVLFYPFLQKHFVKGILVGSLKG